MTESEKVDLSKLRIRRDDDTSEVRSSPRRARSRPLVWGGIFVIIAAVVIFVLQGISSREEIVELATVSLVSPSQVSSVLTASGYVVAQRKAAIASKATGRLLFLGFEEGDHVNEGEIIGRIESADVEAALAQAQANLAVSRAELNDAQQTLNRANLLFERQLISQAELDGAQSRFDRVTASIAAAEAGVQGAEVNVENTRIRAPFSGTILTKNADVGEVVTPFGAGASSRVAVVTIADMSSLEVEADVSESNIVRVSPNQPCEIILDAYPDRRYQGFVSKVVPTADRSKATVMTKIRFKDRDERVLPEMSAKVYFLQKESVQESSPEPKLAVNIGAVTEREGNKVVYLVRDKIATEVPVVLGESFGTMIEVKQGLSANDKVVLKPSETLESWKKIKVKE